MSFINFLGLDDPGYGNFAKGILYVIYEIFWKIVYAIGNLVDVVTGLFYKLAGVNYLGSGNESLVEEQDVLSRLFNQNIISNVSLFMMAASVLLMVVFGAIAVIKQNYFSKEEAKSTTSIIKNMILSFLFLICLAPLALFAISSISTITSSIAGIFGDNTDVSLADLMFNASFSGNPVGAYNSLYGTSITSWTEMDNSFLFDLAYGSTDTGVTFYWYVYLLGGGVIVYNLIILVLKVIKRLFMVIILYLLAPLYVARMVDDGGVKFREWKNKALSELVSIVGNVVAFMILISLIGVISNLELIQLSSSTTDALNGGIVGGVSETVDTTVSNDTTVVLINNLAKIFLIMAGTAVAKDSGDLLGGIFKGANDDSNSLLEGIFNRVGTKDTGSVKTEKSAPRTRVITKTTTSTRKVINYDEVVPSSSTGRDRNVNISSNQRNTFNTSVSNVDRHINNVQNRAEVKVSEGKQVNDSGVKVGNYKSSGVEAGTKINPTDILNQELISGYKKETDQIRSEWGFMKNGNNKDSQEVVKNFETASKEFDSSINTGDQNKIKNSMNKYVDAYRKEEKVAKEGYKDFAGKSTKLSNDLSTKQQDELKKITTAYRKAQVDYGKTARKLSEVSAGNMSAVDALRIKERADKQREKLMEASSRASNFYNNQKKGV